MAVLADLEKLMLVVSIAGYVLLAFQLHRRRLSACYPWFTRYVWVEAAAVSTLTSLLFLRAYRSMGLAYMVLQAVLWIFYILIVHELYTRALGAYPGIARVARTALAAGLIVAVTLSFSTVQADLQLERHSSPLLLYVTVVHRAVATTVTLFLLALTAFLAWFPIRLPANLVFHTTLFFVYFLSLSIGHFYRNLTGSEATPLSNVLLLSLTNLCLLLWILKLRPQGEAVAAPGPGAPGPGDSSWLLARLEALNRTLISVNHPPGRGRGTAS